MRPGSDVAWIDQSAPSGLVEAVGGLPPIFSTFGFEIRLGAGQPGIDLGVGVERAAAGPFLAWCHQRARAERRQGAGWRALESIAAEWARDDGALASVPFLFLEFDCAAGVPGVPSVFVATDHAERDGASSQRFADAVGPVLIALGRRSRLPRVMDVLRVLPRRSRLLHIGIMLSRRASPERLSVAIPRGRVRAYLESLALFPNVAAVVDQIRRFAAVATLGGLPGTVQVDFDVASSRRPALGLTLRPLRPGGWAPIVARLQADGLCDVAQGDTLLGWAGVQRARAGVFGAPVDLHRYVSHVKLAWRGDELRAKAYIGATPSLSLLRQRSTDPASG